MLLSACSKGGEPQPPESTVPVSFEEERPQADKSLRISEIMPKNRATLADGQGHFSPWLELENVSGQDLELSGWRISNGGKEEGWQLPQLTLPAEGKLLVFASEKDGGTQLHGDFSLERGESLFLYDSNGELSDSLLCQAAEADVSLVRCADGSLEACLYPTPGYANDKNSYILLQSRRSCGYPLAIYEAMNANGSFLPQYDYSYPDWVELKNVSEDKVELKDYFLSDDHKDMHRLRLPEMLLEPGESVVVVCEEEGSGNVIDGVIYAPFSLSAEGDRLYLCSESALIDYMYLPAVPLDKSYGRRDGENGFFYFDSPSPGRDNDNTTAYRYMSQKPVNLTADGVFEGEEAVSLILEAEGDIYYTTDGSMPDSGSLRYEGELSIDKSCVLRAVSIEPGAMPSRALSLCYIINEGHSMPVVSVVTDDPVGFFALYRNANKNHTVPGCISFYAPEGSFSADCGVKLAGQTSLNLPKRNLGIRFRGKYGQSLLSYDIFGGGVSEFTDLSLRAGQDHFVALLRNELCQELALDMQASSLTQRSRFCVLYINGEYWGIYVLKDKINEQFYASIADVNTESVTMLDGPAQPYSGFYEDVWAFCVEEDMRLEENYEKLCSRLDIDSLIDWTILECVSGNSDIVSGNVRYCRSDETDGKWHLVFYDLDCAFYHPNLNTWNLLAESSVQRQQISQIIDPLLDNPQFRERFMQRFAQLISGPLSNESILSKLEELYTRLHPEMERNLARWGMDMDVWENNVQRIRDMINDYDWQDYSKDNICSALGLSQEEISLYFPQ